MPLQNPPDISGPPIPPKPQNTGQPQPPGANASAASGTLNTGSNNSGLESLLQSLLGDFGAGAAQQNAGINQAAAGDYGQLQTTDQTLLQQLQNAMSGFGIQQTGLGQEQAYGAQQYGFEQQQQGLSQTGLQQALANLKGQYGFQQQQFGLQGQEIGQQLQQGTQDIQSSGASTGTLDTATNTRAMQRLNTQVGNEQKQLGIERGQAAGQYKYGLQQNTQAEKQLGLTGQEQTAAYKYQQQQLQNALQQLGLQKTEAQQGYTQGTQSAANSYEQQLAQLMQQQGGVYGGEASQIEQLLSQLFQAGSFTGA